MDGQVVEVVCVVKVVIGGGSLEDALSSPLPISYSGPVNITPLGPSPAPPPVAGLGPARRRVLAALLARPEGATIGELSAELGGHPNSIRLHLEGLAEPTPGSPDGAPLVEAAPDRPTGRGRPAIRYRATEAARALPADDPVVSDYRGLVSAFAEHVAAGDDDPSDTSRSIGAGWGRRLIEDEGPTTGPRDEPTDTESSRRAVVNLLGRLGFSPTPHPELPSTVRLTTCPLLDVARTHPQVVCQVHQGLVEGALKALEADADYHVALEPFAEVGACRLRIAEREQG